jgi:hypothetical protein
VRIENLAADRTLGGRGRKLGEVRLRNDHRARRAQLPDHERIVWRNGAFEQHRATRGRHIGRIDIVFHHDRNAVQRRSRSFRLPLGIELARGLQRLRIDHDHRPQHRTLPIEGLNARQEHLDEPLRGQCPLGKRRVHIGNGGGIEIHRSLGRQFVRGRHQYHDDYGDNAGDGLHGPELYLISVRLIS